MKYAVDRIENNIVVLQDLNTKIIKEVNIKTIGFEVNERDILIYKDNKYYKDNKAKQERINILQEKLNRLKKIK